jgi:hypothetical protein
MPGWRQSKYRPDRLGVPKASWYVDGGGIGQRYHGADTRYRHQAPAHVIVPHDGQQTAMQDADLLAKHSPDNQQRVHQNVIGSGKLTHPAP